MESKKNMITCKKCKQEYENTAGPLSMPSNCINPECKATWVQQLNVGDIINGIKGKGTEMFPGMGKIDGSMFDGSNMFKKQTTDKANTKQPTEMFPGMSKIDSSIFTGGALGGKKPDSEKLRTEDSEMFPGMGKVDSSMFSGEGLLNKKTDSESKTPKGKGMFDFGDTSGMLSLDNIVKKKPEVKKEEPKKE